MINSVKSDSFMVQNRLFNSLAATKEAQREATAATTSSESEDTTISTAKDNNELSLDEHIGIMSNSKSPMMRPPMGPHPKEETTSTTNYDTDGDGTISADEYEAAIKDMGVTDADSVEDFFKEYDTNSDGELSMDELGLNNTDTSSKVETASVYDTDEDGSISADEYTAAVKKMGVTDAASADDFFKEYDTNSDGELSLDEIMAGINSYQNQASKAASAYEANYQYENETDSANTDSIV